MVWHSVAAFVVMVFGFCILTNCVPSVGPSFWDGSYGGRGGGHTMCFNYRENVLLFFY